MRRPIEDTYTFRRNNDNSSALELPLPPAGKRRKTIIDAFSKIRISPGRESTLNTSSGIGDGGNSGDGITTGNDPTTETHGSVVAPPNELFMINVEDDDDESCQPLSEKAKLERDIARALVFGARGAPLPPQQDPVEQKICNLIRGSIHKATTQQQEKDPSQQQANSSHITSSQSHICDMDLETMYNRSSIGLFSDEKPRPQSSSLPTMESHSITAIESMDID